MWPFRKKQESPEEVAAEKRLDEATREVALGEFEKEALRQAPLGSSALLGGLEGAGAMRRPVHEDPAPGDEPGLRDALHDNNQKA